MFLADWTYHLSVHFDSCSRTLSSLLGNALELLRILSEDVQCPLNVAYHGGRQIFDEGLVENGIFYHDAEHDFRLTPSSKNPEILMNFTVFENTILIQVTWLRGCHLE